MSATAAPILHIHLDELGRPWIDGTTMKVVELIAGAVVYGWNAEELGRQYPHLTPAQILGALSYYYDNQAAIDAELEGISRDAAKARLDSIDSPLCRRLRAMREIG
jgi:uncharacterized protein (DUF433 family)